MRPLVSLVMIVKNEAASIQAVLEAVKPWVDRWTILDTGSMDGTQKIVWETMQGLYGNLIEEPFIDFATSRNRVLDLDRMFHPQGEGDAVFQFMLSGDEYLCGGDVLRETLTVWRDNDVEMGFIRLAMRGVTLFTPRIFRTGSDWRYEGRVHEIPYNRKNPNSSQGWAIGTMIDHVESDPEGRLNTIWEVHIPMLKEDLKKNPNDERALIFLAQSYTALMPYMEADERDYYAVEAFKLMGMRLAIQTGNAIERNYVEMQMLDTAKATAMFTNKELFDWAKDLAARDPQRPETALLHAQFAMKELPVLEVYKLAAHAAQVSSEAHNIDNSSPIDSSIEWRSHHMAAVAARQIAQNMPGTKIGDRSMEEIVQMHAAEGRRANGPWQAFTTFLPAPNPVAEEK